MESTNAKLQKLEGRLKENEAQVLELKSQRSTLEERLRVYEEEIRHMKDSLTPLEEQNSTPPPAYTEVESAVGTQASFRNANVGPAPVRSYYIWTLLKLLWQDFQRFLRPRPRSGYRRLEWQCVRKFLIAPFFLN